MGEAKMKVAAVVVVYHGMLISVQVFSSTGKARKRYEEMVKQSTSNEYHITLKSELLVY